MFSFVKSNNTGTLFVISNGSSGVGKIWSSVDVGEHWFVVDSAQAYLTSIAFSDYAGFCTTLGETLKSIDNGNTWETDNELTFTSVAFNGDNGYSSDGYGKVFSTTDGGNHWIKSFNAGRYYAIINPLNASTCLLFGAGDYSGGDLCCFDGAVLQTNDAGQQWSKIVTTNTYNFYSTSFYSDKEGYATDEVKVTVK